MELKGPSHSAPKIFKSPETRQKIIAGALVMLSVAGKGKSFGSLRCATNTDRVAYRQALPAGHVRDGKFSKAARVAWHHSVNIVCEEHGDVERGDHVK